MICKGSPKACSRRQLVALHSKLLLTEEHWQASGTKRNRRE